jgi:hypothetical protein
MPAIAATVATDNTTRCDRSDNLCVRTHRQATSYRHRSGQIHSAHSRSSRVTIHYAYHPRCGESVTVLAQRKHQGVLAYLIEQPDTTRTWLPSWMTQESAANLRCVEWPALSLAALEQLHTLVNHAVASPDHTLAGSHDDETQNADAGGSTDKSIGSGDSSSRTSSADSCPADGSTAGSTAKYAGAANRSAKAERT